MRVLRKSFLTALAAVALIGSVASAQEQFVIAANSSSGTYSKMLGELTSICSTDNFNIVMAKNDGGAPGNLDALVNNKANAAFLHSDVYFANAMADPSYAKFQTLIALYPEPIHVLALRQSKTSKIGIANFGKQEFNSLADARGFKVGAAGGGVFTARILTGQGEGGFSVISYDKGDDVIAALNNGDIALAIFVGAAPLPNLEKLNKNAYKLIPVGESIAGRVTSVYRPATINYNGFTQGPVKTIAPMATLLTKKYSTPRLIATQRHLRECFNQHLGELKDTGSPNWQNVEANDHGVLPWYDIEGTSAPVTAKKKP